jgi:hypothetical protein
MRLSESLRKNIFETSVGGIINRFKVGKRRNPFFFDEIGLGYVKLCDQRRYNTELMEMSREWGFILFEKIVSPVAKKLPLPYLMSCNVIVKKLFRHLGYMDSIQFSRKEDDARVKTMSEENVKIIGINSLHTGLYMGFLTSIFSSDIEFLDARDMGNGNCEYKFKILKKPPSIRSKDRREYDKLNQLSSVHGSTIKDALKLNIFNMKNNKIYFRGKTISNIENTIFHLFGNRGILLDEVPKISHDYFKNIVEKDSSKEEKLNMIKSLLQVMGWGIIKITMEERKIVFHINNPPYGLQLEKDNWSFLIRVILGYLWLLNKEFKIRQVKTSYKKLIVDYSV